MEGFPVYPLVPRDVERLFDIFPIFSPEGRRDNREEYDTYDTLLLSPYIKTDDTIADISMSMSLIWNCCLPKVILYYMDGRELGNEGLVCDLVDYFGLSKQSLEKQNELLFLEGLILCDQRLFEGYKRHNWKILQVRNDVTNRDRRRIGLNLIKQASNGGCSKAIKCLKW